MVLEPEKFYVLMQCYMGAIWRRSIVIFHSKPGFLCSLLSIGDNYDNHDSGIDETLVKLPKLARYQGINLNVLSLHLLREATGIDKRKRTQGITILIRSQVP